MFGSRSQFTALAFVLVCLCASARAQQPPPEAKTAPPSKPQAAKEKDPDYSQEAFVIEKLQTLFRFEKDGTGQREVRLRARVQSEAGVQGFGQLIFPYSSGNENLEIENVSVHKSDGSVVKAAATDVQDLTAPISREAPIYTDLRQKHVTVPGLRPGDVLEYHVIWHLQTPLAPNHFWFNHDFLTRNLIVLDEQLEVNIPRDSKVKLKTEKGFEATPKELDNRRVYSWKHANLKREDKDEKEDEAKNKDDDDDPKPAQIQMTTFQSWGEVGQWYATLVNERTTPDDKIRAKVEEQIKGITTDKEKVEALYGYVARNFRYVSLSLGQGRYQPHAAADVFANQYGDCKDKHTLLTSMLKAAGIRAYPALMNSSRKIDPDVPSPAQFDHVISAIPLGSETLWMDTTAEVAPFRLLSRTLRNKQALLIPDASPAGLVTTPADPPFAASELVEVDGQVNDLGKLNGHSHLTLRGDSELMFRVMFRRTPKAEWKQLGQYLSFLGGVRGEVSEVKPTDPAAVSTPFQLEYEFAKDDFLDWSSKKTRVGLPLPAMHLVAVDGDKSEDSKPIDLGSPIEVTHRLKLNLPAKYQSRLPVPLNVARDYAEYHSSYKLEGNTLLVERTLRIRQREIPAARAQDYRAFVASARADEEQSLALETSVTGTATIPETVKVEELLQAANAAGKSQNFPLAEQLFRRALEKEPKHKIVRRQLGWVLYVQRKDDEAITVLQEQTKINPFDDYAYNLLGQIYWRAQKYLDSETSFRKQLEVTPLNQYAQANLGQMLVEARRFKDAVPELEKAISLDPDAEMLYVSLGRAYLKLNETDKGIEAFEKAIKLAPGPLVWNDVSYNLSLSKVQLDRAQQYAESAVTQVANEMRNVELERLTLRDLGGMSAIAAYWDTLGWVHYQKGELEIAEKYINAAWALGQHSEVGYHLGQILEKRGKNDEAIHMYALAAVANRTVPEPRESLDRLAGKEKSEELVKRAKDELSDTYTVKLGSLLKDLKDNSEAEFYVVLVPGPAHSTQVADVKFIRGDEKLRTQAAALKSAHYSFNFPDETSTKVIRRGTLLCKQKNGGCSFILLSPEYVTSVE